jgi:ADP-ribosylglycohydrolase
LESTDLKPYGSLGNGSAMRVSPVGFAFDSLDEVLLEAKRSAEVTHNHPEGIKGAQATAAAVFLARTGKGKAEIRDYVSRTFQYDLNRTIEEIRPSYQYSERCQETVPEAIIAFFDSSDYEDAIRKSISLGGDADTLACITGGIAEAFFNNIPEQIVRHARKLLDKKLLLIIDEFCSKKLKNI